MACPPSGITVDIVGINAADNGRSCEAHEACGAVLKADNVVRLQVAQIKVDDKEETAIALYGVSGGVDTCHIGFLRQYLLKYKDKYDARLAQIIEIFTENSESPSDRNKARRNLGYCRATLIEAKYCNSPRKKVRQDETKLQ
eukprot:scaffold1999_cov153-Amphora_coffeaeformis.AAC.16